ncbi:MAG: SGNH/GDSL hydrolase family protein [Phocaeicola sp.]|uniref:SGNH/GDSL hydrolase family protein n=1 Tax=Phocaeicola sp. TaxID=2773926 RepID=UPI0023D59AF8|nr:SGNH/GDSL hydrolase family protein [Phocaeicola sp.]MDE6179797.1 SGNH/GDSL hydrolase family protein [Phocaeicola sp.]
MKNSMSFYLFFSIVTVFLSFPCMYAQDAIPVLPSPLNPLQMSEQTREMHYSVRLITVRDSLPGSFVHVLDNVIEDKNHSLSVFFQKLSDMAGPVRVVHIGDSHVRGHLYPLVTRRCLENDFGSESVFPDTISYRTSGLARETGEPGIVYHIYGINGATSLTFSDEEKVKEIASLHPDLIIVSFGTNEAHSRRYQVQTHKSQVDKLLFMLREACPEVTFLLTTPPGAYVGRRKVRTINPRTVWAAHVIKEYAQEHQIAVWDMYNIIGGKTDACRNWTKHNMLRPDGIHFTPEGYRLQGNLLHQALIKAYNNYVATRLE